MLYIHICVQPPTLRDVHYTRVVVVIRYKSGVLYGAVVNRFVIVLSVLFIYVC